METSTAEAAVVGGGLAGLTAALILARAGRRVTLYEKARALGGRAQSQTRDRFTFNLGPHALYRAGAAARVLRGLGIPFHGGVPPAKGGLGMRDGSLWPLPSTLAALLSTRMLSRPAKWELARFMTRLWTVETAPLDQETLASWAARSFRQPQARETLLALIRVTTYSNAPEQFSAGAALDQFKLGVRNVWYLDGGWQTLVQGLRTAAENAGVRFVVGSRVHSVLLHQGRAAGLQLDQGVQAAATQVVLAVAPEEVRTLAPSLAAQLPPEMPIRAGCLTVALKSLPRPKTKFVLGIDRAAYFSSHTAVAKLAPEGMDLVDLARYLEPGEREGPDHLLRELEAFLDLCQPGWRALEIGRQFMPSLVVHHALPLAQRGGVRGRPSCEVPEVSGLYLAGDWVGPEGMLADAALASAEQATAAALGATMKAA